jgi:hypothetical protein
VFTPNNDRPYFESWLRRTRKQFAVSGRLTQIATMLAAENGGTVDAWRVSLRNLLDGKETPGLELLTRIDALLAGAPTQQPIASEQEPLF